MANGAIVLFIFSDSYRERHILFRFYASIICVDTYRVWHWDHRSPDLSPAHRLAPPKRDDPSLDMNGRAQRLAGRKELDANDTVDCSGGNGLILQARYYGIVQLCSHRLHKGITDLRVGHAESSRVREISREVEQIASVEVS